MNNFDKFITLFDFNFLDVFKSLGFPFGLDFNKINAVCKSIKECVNMGVQVGLMVGAGNCWRGVKDGADKMQRSHADAMGMMATVMNAIAVADVLEQHGMDARVLTAVEMHKFAEYFTRDTANRYLNEGKVVLFAAGTGNPYFSTDTGAALRAAEIGADAMLMAKNIDYIYTADPKKDPTATPIYDVTYAEIIEKNLRAFDMSAVIFCQDNNIESYGFGLADPENIYRAVMGEPVGTRMHN